MLPARSPYAATWVYSFIAIFAALKVNEP